MLKRLTWIAFNAIGIIAATGTAVSLILTGHTLHIGGLLLAMGGVVGTILLAFRLAGGYGPGELSIWAGPFRSLTTEPSIEPERELRQAA